MENIMEEATKRGKHLTSISAWIPKKTKDSLVKIAHREKKTIYKLVQDILIEEAKNLSIEDDSFPVVEDLGEDLL